MAYNRREMRSACLFVVFLGVALQEVSAADPDPLRDFESGVTTFTLKNIFTNGDVSRDTGGIRAATNITNFPALKSQGLSIVRFRMVPCGSNLPHTHPRATEVLSLLAGGPLQAGFVDTNGVAHIAILYPGDVTVFPRGMLHFETNLGTKVADYLSALNSENPGTLTQSEALFQLPARTVAIAFNVSLNETYSLNETVHRYGPGLKKTSDSGCVPGENISIGF